MRATLPDALFVNWTSGSKPEFDFTLAAGKTVALWLDNAQEYANDREAPAVNLLPARFGAARLIVVATSRDGPDLEAVSDKLAPLTRRLAAIPLADITRAETDELAGDLEREGQSVDRGTADGTPGSILLGVEAMRDQRYPKLPDGAQAVLKAMALLRSAGTYDYPTRRVGAVARGIFTLSAGRGAWDTAVEALVKSDFVRLGRAVDEEGLRALEPVADVYLERAVKDYPAAGTALTDQWPALQDVLTREHDAYALFDLGSAYNGLRIGLDSAVPYDLRSARQRAEQCFREVLALLPADDSDRPGAQNNLGTALRAQAGLATGDEQRRLLGEAVEAYRAALGASTPGTPDWAGWQNNLGVALAAQAGLATGAEQRRLLGEAVEAYRAALSAATPGTPAWAGRQNNLGVALRAQAGLATGAEQRRLLGEAVEAYRAALTVRTREHDPNGWADTQFNVAALLLQRAAISAWAYESDATCEDLREVLRAVRGAEEIYHQGRPADERYAVELRQVIGAALAELGCPSE